MGVIHSNGLLLEYHEIFLHVQNAGHIVCLRAWLCVRVCETGFVGGTGTAEAT